MTRNSWIHYTDWWILKYVDQIVVLLQHSIEQSCQLYTHVSSILQCIGPCNLFGSVWSMFVNNGTEKTTPVNGHTIDKRVSHDRQESEWIKLTIITMTSCLTLQFSYMNDTLHGLALLSVAINRKTTRLFTNLSTSTCTNPQLTHVSNDPITTFILLT